MAVLEYLNRLLGRNDWPPAALERYWRDVELYAALRDSEEAVLRAYADWEHRRPMLHAPVARLISRTSAHLLFGQPPHFHAASEGDQARLDFIIEENGLEAELHRAAVLSSSEGAAWGRIIVDPALCDAPIIEFESPRCVIPLFAGRFVAGATFVAEEADDSEVWRRFETYEPGAVRTSLYRGTSTSLGSPVGLGAHPLTEGRDGVVYTGFDYPLCVFVPNSIDTDPECGVSDYHGLVQRLLGITEAGTVGLENMRLAGQQRALVDERYLQGGRLPAKDHLLVTRADDRTAGEAPTELQMLSYSFDAAALIAFTEHLVDTTLQLAGIAPEVVGRNMDGGAVSGTALRFRMIHSLMERSGKAGYFDRGVKRLLRMAAVIDSRRTTEGGFGRRWSTPDGVHTLEFEDAIPQDDDEAARVLVALSNAEAIAQETKVAYFHPDWTQTQVDEEVKRLKAETAAPPGLPSGGIANPLAHPAMRAARDAALGATAPAPAGDTPTPQGG
jgi:Phage portal protein, SPP1 Gp6-like